MNRPVVYRTYVFRTKDPVIDELRTLAQDRYGGDRDAALKEAGRDVQLAGGPRAATLRGWFHGKTRRPQSASVEAAGRALGYRREWVRARGPKLDEAPK